MLHFLQANVTQSCLVPFAIDVGMNEEASPPPVTVCLEQLPVYLYQTGS
jgi:hypothetical protein